MTTSVQRETINSYWSDDLDLDLDLDVIVIQEIADRRRAIYHGNEVPHLWIRIQQRFPTILWRKGVLQLSWFLQACPSELKHTCSFRLQLLQKLIVQKVPVPIMHTKWNDP